MRRVHGVLIGLLLVAGPVLAQEDHPAASLPVPNSSLSPEERAKAISLALPEQSAVSSLTLSRTTSPRTVVSSVQATDDSKGRGRQALVTIYQYQGNVTVRRLVDLEQSRVVSEERSTDATPPLSPAEQEYARALVLSDNRVAQLLGGGRNDTTVELLLTHTAQPDSPFAGKRVVMALFKTPSGYLSRRQKVFANLTDGTVVFQD